MKKVYKGKVDLWIILVLLLSTLAMVGIFSYSIWDAIMKGEDYVILLVIVIIVMVVTLLITVPIFLNNKVEIENEIVLIKFGLFSAKIPISSITYIGKIRSVLSSYALSLDRVLIRFGNTESIMIATVDNDEFIKLVNKVILKNKLNALDN